jgi:hypothetical protein
MRRARVPLGSAARVCPVCGRRLLSARVGPVILDRCFELGLREERVLCRRCGRWWGPGGWPGGGRAVVEVAHGRVVA